MESDARFEFQSFFRAEGDVQIARGEAGEKRGKIGQLEAEAERCRGRDRARTRPDVVEAPWL